MGWVPKSLAVATTEPRSVLMTSLHHLRDRSESLDPPTPPLPPTPTPPTFHPDQRLQLPPVLTGNSWDSCWKSILRDCKRVHSYLCTWLFSARSTAKVMSYRVTPKSREEVWFAVSDTQHRFVFDEKNTKAGVGGVGVGVGGWMKRDIA